MSLFPTVTLKHELLVNSKSPVETLTTRHYTRDYRRHRIVAPSRGSFESEELDIVRGIPGSQNYAYVLTKRKNLLLQ